MVRTKDTGNVKVAGAKATRKITPAPPTPTSSASGSAKKKYSGGNPYCPRETPAWQKPITNFFSNGGAGTSTSSDAENQVNGPADEILAEELPSTRSEDAGSSENGAEESNKENAVEESNEENEVEDSNQENEVEESKKENAHS